MNKISKIAIKTSGGKIVSGPIGVSHADLKVKGKHGFLDASGKFVNRVEGKKIANVSGQSNTKKPLHSHMLRKRKK